MEALIHRLAGFAEHLTDAAAVTIVAYGVIEAFVHLVGIMARPRTSHGERKKVWRRFGVWLLLGLEFELAADIIGSIVSPTWEDIGQLGAIAVIRFPELLPGTGPRSCRRGRRGAGANPIMKDLIEQARRLSRPYRVEHGKRFRLKDVDPGDRGGLDAGDKPRALEALRLGTDAIAELQDRLYAQDRWSLLLVFQAIDAAGKDSAIKHVMSGVNPQGCQVFSFKAPSSEDLDHDYLWRSVKALPERGRIGIFNRSYYEEIVVVRVHRELLEYQKVPRELLDVKDLWKERGRDICNFEDYLSRNGTLVRKFFLHVSKKEQGKRFRERLDKPEKNWKFSAADLRERDHWNEYQEAYEDMIRRTATPAAPWYVVPADNKWFTRIVVAAAIVDALAGLKLEYPVVSKSQQQEIALAKEALGDGSRKAARKGRKQ